MSKIAKKFSRRTIALFWTMIVGIVIGGLIYYEQISVLYVLATLSLVVLLLIVGFADLERVSVDGSTNPPERAE
jgi:ABC-type bacteriocin/lantibiotic exporter with double-glycine peptidase domain